jgi:hypothetical protein
VATKLVVGFLVGMTCMAQNWEFSGGGGYGVYHNVTISGPGGTATAGIRNAYTVTGVVNEDLWEHFSGEVRYVYQAGGSFLQSGSVQGGVQGYSHTFTYDALLHVLRRERRIRPYGAFGVGAKYFGTSGTTPKPQPVPAVAVLTTRSQWEPVFDFGGGVKFRVTDHIVISGLVRDYISPYPKDLLVPVGGARARGVLQQVTPMAGIGYTF